MKKIYILLAIFTSFPFIKSQSNLCVTDITFTYYTLSIFTSNGNIYTWGTNQHGQVGNGSTVAQNSIWLRPSSPVFAKLNHSLFNSAGLTPDGKIYTWGNNLVGSLGDGTIISKLTPIQMGTESNWLKVATGTLHNVALKNNGTIWGWGNNGACEVSSVNQGAYYTQPLQISPDNDWVDVSAGSYKTFAIKSNGTLWGRGKNNKYAIGLGIPSYPEGACISNLTQIGTATDWQKISAAAYDNYTLALKNNNTLWGWGDNIEGAVGNGVAQLVQTPVQIGSDTWLDASAGNPFAAGIKSNGTLWWWGKAGCSAPQGVFGPNSYAPIQVGTESNWLKVAAGSCSIFALRNDNTVWAFGSWIDPFNNGSITSSFSPVLIFQCSLSTSENDKELSNIVLYPNPTVDKISWAQNISVDKVTIYDVSGKIVLSEKTSQSFVNVSHLPLGAYFIKLERKDKTFYNSKFIKK